MQTEKCVQKSKSECKNMQNMTDWPTQGRQSKGGVCPDKAIICHLKIQMQMKVQRQIQI